MPELTHLEKARRYLKAIEDGDAGFVVSLFSPDACIEQLPNKIYPQGSRASVSRISENFDKGRKIFAHQTYEIINEAATGNTVALEVIWTGKLAVAFGTLAAGSEMRAFRHVFGISRQQNRGAKKLRLLRSLVAVLVCQ